MGNARQTPDEMLQEVKKRLAIKQWNISYQPHDWFFPNDVAPHNAKFKYVCKKLYSLGMLEGSRGGRWGWTYRVARSSQ